MQKRLFKHHSGIALAVMISLLGWPIAGHAQRVGPTPQPPGVPIAPDDAPPEDEFWAAHAQATNTWELQPGYRSPFRGAQSLPPGAEGRETADVTIYAGVRPWSGAEFWANPEVDQGFGLGNTFGVAGYPSGEAYKVGAANPYFMVPRAFLRQTIDLGGDTERLDADLNQLAGTQTADRLVFTVGKLSVVDIFDTNKYAHDPRHDFLNWSIVDGGAFDYAANAWGFTYGAAAEWYQDWWTVRTGAFALSKIPNAPDLYPGTRQGQWVTELEERHTLWDQPGKLKLLYWLSWGELGSYIAAIEQGAATGQTPSTANVRHFQTKDGVGLNLEQQVVDDIGVFARASLSQGSVEEIEFTDINQSVSAGALMTGKRWSRPDDTIGLAAVQNYISHDGKLYLAAGGLGGIIGDGALTSSGPEKIVETFYNVAVLGFAQVTLDYQFIDNPAYNRDRGPVSIFGLRLHAQY
jgi:high affinity Mn2+ porin